MNYGIINTVELDTRKVVLKDSMFIRNAVMQDTLYVLTDTLPRSYLFGFSAYGDNIYKNVKFEINNVTVGDPGLYHTNFLSNVVGLQTEFIQETFIGLTSPIFAFHKL